MARETCPVCAASSPTRIEYRENVPALVNRLANSVAEARGGPRGTLDVVGCPRCGFVWNRAFDANNIPYDSEYENDQTHSESFRGHMERMIERILGTIDPHDPIDLAEVGCGQGTFLRALTAQVDKRLRTVVGFDPAFRAKSEFSDPRVRVFNEYFNEQTVLRLEHQPSVVMTRHTIEHVADPVAFLSTIRASIQNTGARLFVETPDVEWILARSEIEDLFYEHCSLFGPESLALCLRSAHFEPVRIDCVFDGQYLWAEATPSAISDDVKAVSPTARYEFPEMSRLRDEFVQRWRQRIAERSTIVWGAGAKGVTYCTLIDPDQSRIAGVVDINPGKQGKFIPTTGHRVYAPEELPSLNAELVIVMNPNYRSEIAATLRAMGVTGSIATLGDEAGD